MRSSELHVLKFILVASILVLGKSIEFKYPADESVKSLFETRQSELEAAPGATAGSTTAGPWKPAEVGTVDCRKKDAETDYTYFRSLFQASFHIDYEAFNVTDIEGIPEVEDDNSTITRYAAVNMPGGVPCVVDRNDGTGEDCSQINATFTWTDSTEWTLKLMYEVSEMPDKGDLCTLKKQDDWDSFEYLLQGMEFTYVLGEDYFPNAVKTGDQEVVADWSMDLFKVDSDSSYKCETNETHEIGSSTTTLYFKDYQSQAFQFEEASDSQTDFDTAKLCSDDDDGSSLVPIIVGCVLAGLIILTLVAYFIGRWHQNRQESYQAL